MQRVLADLANRRLSYDENTTRLRRIIAEDGGQPEPQALCELLEIPREKWQNAVEGYLNTRRFDLIVRPEDFWPPAARQGAQRYLSERRRHGNAEIARRFDANRKTNVSHLDNLRERLRQERSNYNRDYQFGGAIDAPDNAAYEAEQSKLAETATVRDYEVHILNRLLDRYERSAHFRRTPEEQASARGVFLPFEPPDVPRILDRGGPRLSPGDQRRRPDPGSPGPGADLLGSPGARHRDRQGGPEPAEARRRLPYRRPPATPG